MHTQTVPHFADSKQMAGAQLGQPIRAGREMERIGVAADRVERLVANLQDIAGRFHGATPNASGPDPAPITVSYLGNMDRLHGTLDLAEQLVSQIGDIA